MKKSLLFLGAMLLASASTFAQKPTSSVKAAMKRAATTEFVKAQVAPEAMAPVRDVKATNSVWKAPRRSVGNGFWYQRPEGSLYVSGSNSSSGAYWSYLYMPTFTEVLYKNMAEDKDGTTWKFITNTGNSYTPEQLGATVTEENDLKVVMPKIPENYISSLYIPQLSMGRRTYIFGDGMNDGENTIASTVALINGDSITAATNVNLAVGYYYGFSNGSSFGNTVRQMTMDDGSVVEVKTNALYEFYKKPITPLCISELFFRVVNYEGTPLMNDDTQMKVTVRKVNDDGSIGDVIADMPFSMADATYVENEDGKTFGAFLVSQKEQDAFGTEYAVPFIVKDEFVIIISGFEQPDVNFGLYMSGDLKGTDTDCFLNDGLVTPTCRSYVRVDNGEPLDGLYYCQAITKEQSDYYNEQDGDTYDWTRHYNAVIHLYCMNDVVKIADGFENMIADPEGGIVYASITETNPDTGQEETNLYGNIQYQSTLPRLSTWEGYEGEENYQFEGMPDWLKIVAHEDKYYDPDVDEQNDYYTLTQFEAEPLPAGLSGRKAEIHIVSERGADAVFTVTQGEPGDDPQPQDPVVFDFVAAGAAGEAVTKANLNFQVNMGEGKEDRTNRDFRGYKDYTGTVLPAECQVALGEEMKFDAEGLIVNQNRYLAIYGLKTGQVVKVWYEGAGDKVVTFCPGTSVDTKASINGTELVTGVSPIASGDAIKIDAAGEKNYIVMSVFSGMHIRQVIIAEDEATGIKNVNNEVKKNNAIFTLSGQRVAVPVRGQIYIQNGKKFMVK